MASRRLGLEARRRSRAEGETAFEARSRRRKRSPTATEPPVVALICELRRRLAPQGLGRRGLDAGRTRSRDTSSTTVARIGTVRRVHRILVRAGPVTPAPKKGTAVGSVDSSTCPDRRQTPFAHAASQELAYPSVSAEPRAERGSRRDPRLHGSFASPAGWTRDGHRRSTRGSAVSGHLWTSANHHERAGDQDRTGVLSLGS